MALAVEALLTFAAETAVEQLTPHALELLAEAGWEPTAEVLGVAWSGYQKYKKARQVGKIASRLVSGPRVQEQQQEQQQHPTMETSDKYHPRRKPWERAVKSAMKFQIRHTPDRAQLRNGAKAIIKSGMNIGQSLPKSSPRGLFMLK